MDKQEILFHQLFQTVRAITKGVNAALESQELYSSEWSIITTLKQREAITQAELASYLSIEPPAISRSLAALEKKGLITRCAGRDRREKKVTLSKLALEKYPVWLEATRKQRGAVLSALSEPEQEMLQTLLARIFTGAQSFGKIEQKGVMPDEGN